MDITATVPSHDDHGHLVVFNVAPYSLCAPAAEVEGIIVVPHLRPLPQAPPSTIGVVQHRGQVYRVISLRRKLGLESGPPLLEGQLILTRLSCGLTAFLVDEVLDVRPAENFVYQPLSPHSPMDFFDAFLLQDEQILLHTTFAQMEQAREIPFPSPDLTAASTAAAEPSSSNSRADRDAGRPESRDPKPTRQRIENSANQRIAASRAHSPLEQKVVPEDRDAPPGPLPERTPRPLEAGFAPFVRQPPQSRMRPTRPAGSRRPLPRHHRRSRRYAVALTAFLILLLFVVLSSAFWLKARFTSGERPSRQGAGLSEVPNSRIPVKPRPAASQKPLNTPSPPEVRPHDQGNKRPPTGGDTPTLSPPSLENRSTDTPAAGLPPDLRREKAANHASEPPSPGSGSLRQILRLDSDAFTLTVERPNRPLEEPNTPSGRRRLTSGSEIIHRVVPGDTLWDIAADYLGDPFQYAELARLSRIRNPDLIYPGDIVRIRRKPTLGRGGTHPAHP